MHGGVIKEMKRGSSTVAGLALCLITAGSMGLLLVSCSAALSSSIRADGGARISIRAEVPGPIAAKLRRLAASGSSASTGPFFDMAAVRKSIAARPSLSLLELKLPSPDSIQAELTVRSLEELAASADLKGSGLLTMNQGSLWSEFRFHLERGSAKALTALFPGIDPYLMDALSPPALEEDPVTSAEYRTMLKGVFGEKAMPSMEAAMIEINITAPGVVVDSGGGRLSGSTLSTRVPLIQVLSLEKPIDLWLRWKK